MLERLDRPVVRLEPAGGEPVGGGRSGRVLCEAGQQQVPEQRVAREPRADRSGLGPGGAHPDDQRVPRGQLLESSTGDLDRRPVRHGVAGVEHRGELGRERGHGRGALEEAADVRVEAVEQLRGQVVRDRSVVAEPRETRRPFGVPAHGGDPHRGGPAVGPGHHRVEPGGVELDAGAGEQLAHLGRVEREVRGPDLDESPRQQQPVPRERRCLAADGDDAEAVGQGEYLVESRGRAVRAEQVHVVEDEEDGGRELGDAVDQRVDEGVVDHRRRSERVERRALRNGAGDPDRVEDRGPEGVRGTVGRFERQPRDVAGCLPRAVEPVGHHRRFPGAGWPHHRGQRRS